MNTNKLINMGLEVVELEMSENNERAVFEIEEKLWGLQNVRR